MDPHRIELSTLSQLGYQSLISLLKIAIHKRVKVVFLLIVEWRRCV
jgi:hypothetical protein